MDIVLKTFLGALVTAFVALLMERARRYYKVADTRGDEKADRQRRSDKFDSLLSAARRWRRKAILCLELHGKSATPDPTVGYALTDFVNELDLTEWEPKPEANET